MKKLLVTAALVTVLSMGSARAEDVKTSPYTVDNVKLGFAQAIKDIQTWFGDDTPDSIEPAAGTQGVAGANDDYLQVPTPVDPSVIEPAAGAFDDDTLQVPPPYVGPQSSNAMPRATAFDNNASQTAFGEAPLPVIQDFNAIVPAAGEGTTVDTSKVDCNAVLEAADDGAEGQEIDEAVIKACTNDASGTTDASSSEASELPAVPRLAPAQPAFETTPMPVVPQALPETQPSSGQ